MTDDSTKERRGDALAAVIIFPGAPDAWLARLARGGFEAGVVRVEDVDPELFMASGRVVVVHVAAGALDLCLRARDLGRDEPIIALYTMFDESEKQSLLEAGADAYESVDTAPRTLAAVCHRVAGRAARARPPDVVVVGDIRLDRPTRSVTVAGVTRRLPNYAFELIDSLAARPGQVVTYAEVRQRWGSAAAPDSNIEAVTVRALRKALGRAGHQVETVPGIGYRLVAAPSGAGRARSSSSSGKLKASGVEVPRAD